MFNYACLAYLDSPTPDGLALSPSSLLSTLRLTLLALTLLPLLLALSSGARALSAGKDESLAWPARHKGAAAWACTVGSAVGVFGWARYATAEWELSGPWKAYQALMLVIAVAGVVYHSTLKARRGLDSLDEFEPLEYATPPGSPPSRSASSTPTRTTPRGSRENLVAMIA